MMSQIQITEIKRELQRSDDSDLSDWSVPMGEKLVTVHRSWSDEHEPVCKIIVKREMDKYIAHGNGVRFFLKVRCGECNRKTEYGSYPKSLGLLKRHFWDKHENYNVSTYDIKDAIALMRGSEITPQAIEQGRRRAYERQRAYYEAQEVSV